MRPDARPALTLRSPDPTPPPADDVALLIDGALSPAAAAEQFGVSESTLYGAMSRGELAYTHCGTRRLIPRRALAEWLARGLVPATK